jgi:DNA-binding MarR family transcriptional regulator
MKNVNVQTLKVTEKKFFRLWITLLQPFLKLSEQELNILAYLLYYRHIILKEVKNKSIVNDLLFNTKTRNKIKEDLNIPGYSFNNKLTSLRKKGLIVDNVLNQKIIPVIEDDFTNFKLVYDVNIIKEKQQ